MKPETELDYKGTLEVSPVILYMMLVTALLIAGAVWHYWNVDAYPFEFHSQLLDLKP